MKTETNYRMLEPDEKVENGDEYQYGGRWQLSSNHSHGVQMFNTKYRRPLPAFVPQWKHPDAPSCPVHVLWAESPSTVRTVAQVAAEAKPKASVAPGTGYRLLGPEEIILAGDQFHGHKWNWVDVDGTIGQKQGVCGWVIRRKIKAIVPGAGYRLLGDDEIVEFGDEWHNPGSSQGDWNKATGSVGHVAGTMSFTYRRKLPSPLCLIDPPAGYYILGPDEVWQEGDMFTAGDSWEPLCAENYGKTSNTYYYPDVWKRWCCRKLPVPEPQYRPYANAAEAAAGLQGKLIRKEDRDWVPVTRVCEGSVLVGNLNPTFKQLLAYKFTDGTPCGVLTTNQGTK